MQRFSCRNTPEKVRFQSFFQKKSLSDVMFFLLIRLLNERNMKPEEFNDIIIPMRGQLKNFALGMTGDDDNAEDLVQEVMLRLWDMRASLGVDENNKALAMTMLRNKFNDRWRHNRLEQGTEMKAEPAYERSAVEAADEVALVRLIVEHLPPLQQRIFRMKEIEGYDTAEIMQITGCSVENLRQNLSRARKKIREDFIRLTLRKKSR